MNLRSLRTGFGIALALTLVVAFSGSAAFAQETVGALAGTVTDAQDGSALPGVTVTATNPDNGSNFVQVTDGGGRFRFSTLAIGGYKVTAALDSYQTLEQEVRISLGGTTTLSMSMPLGDFTDTITITSSAPLVDVTSTVSGVTINTGETADRVPISRDIAQVALLAPGTTGGDTSFDSSSRAYTPGQTVSSIGGASVAENTYLVNGLNITNFRNGVGGSNVPFEFVEEVQVKTGGYEAEFGRSTGGVLNMVTKSGSNSIHGGVNAYFQPESLQEQSPDYFNGFNSAEIFESTEANFTIGGPIYRDRAFFFGFYQHNDVTFSTVGVSRDTELTRDDPYYGGKLDVNITPSHRLEGTYFTDEVTVDSGQFEFDGVNRTAGVGGGFQEAGGTNTIAKYTGIFGSRFVASAQFGTNEFDRNILSSADELPFIYDSREGGLVALGGWVNSQVGVADDEREATRLDFDYFIGNHSLRAGLDDETNTSNDLTQYSGGEYYRYFLVEEGERGLPAGEAVRFREFFGGGEFETISNAFYVQDSFEVTDRLLVNAGVRVEEFDNKNSLGESFIESSDQYAPRLGATYDLRGDGRSKIFANAGHYHLYIASNTNIRLAGAETFTEDWFTLLPGCDVNNPTQGSCLGTPGEANVFGDGSVPDVRATKSSNLDPMYQDEASVGFEQMVGDNWSVGVRGAYRSFGEIIEDITIDAALTAQGLAGPGAFEYRLANPAKEFLGFFDPNHDGNLIPVSFSAAELGYPEAERDYFSVEFTWNRRFADNWMLQGSATWSHSYGNYEGYVRSDNGQDDAGITTLYDFAGLLDNGAGNLPNDRRYNLKSWGAYQFDNGLMIGSGISWRDGRPINAFGIHPTDEFAALYGAESFFAQGVATPRGSLGRTDDVINVDLTTKYDFDFGSTNVTVRADVFNVFDSDAVTQVNETADEESGVADVNFLSDTRFQSPRRVRFSVGFTF